MSKPVNKSSGTLQGKVAIVTGGGTGIGRAIALEYAGAGANVAVAGRRLTPLKEVCSEIEDLGREALAVQTDISKKTDVNLLVASTIDKFGAIDVLVNNAAIVSRTLIMEITEDEWDKIININLKGCHLCCQAVGKKMIERKKGNIINVASIAGVSTCGGRSMSVYGISKAGVIRLTKGLAWELGKYNIRVNAIAPGPVLTDMLREVLKDPDRMRQEESITPLGRLVEPREIATIAVFLATDASIGMTGGVILADSGQQLT